MTEAILPAYISTSDERGSHMADFIHERIRPLENLRVLDIGCRLGGISMAFARRSRQVIAIDVVYDEKRAHSWKEKTCKSKYIDCADNLHFGIGNGLALPFPKDSFDVVIINGVLEWVGAVEMPQNPRDLQIQFLKEVRRTLKPNGFFYLAIENRLFPGYIVKDSHTYIPLIGILPRKLADDIARRFYGQPYRTYTYSYWGLEKLVREAGFADVSFFTPLDTYWYPYAIESVADRKRILYSLNHPNLGGASEQYRRAALVSREQRLFIRAIAWLGLTKVFCNAFATIGFK